MLVLDVMDIKREKIPLIWSSVGETALVFVLTWAYEVSMSAEKLSCLEVVFTVGKSEI